MKKKNLNSLHLSKKLISKLNFNSLLGGAEGNTTIIGNTCNSCPDMYCPTTGDLYTSNDPARCPKPKPPIRNGASAPHEESTL
ncbi:hypothetical protein [uncultured Kordia sp.]|uniref:hypothetical protein n=1 Tax=uncultured Kordia sp. TaxID=507699 RepID=UPI002617C80A|nr:hypothetical protein [uncultured Kordia sp.]